ncbi:MAG: zeta toxin family protein [Paludibacteraceae bacterium]|nr:zeta toxin family protein [Paludibacteraceae bacterium]
MPKINTPNQKKAYSEHNSRLNRYTALLQALFDTYHDEAAKMAVNAGYSADAETPFKFSDYPQTKRALEELQSHYVADIRSTILSGTSKEWEQSNLLQDLLVKDVMRSYKGTINGQKKAIYYQKNSDALKAFQQRKDKGLNLSAKLWNQSQDYKQWLEAAISSGIEKGTSAVALSKRLSKYASDFDLLKTEYKTKFGKAADILDCEYKAARLARTEINMAYRTAEQTRWKQLDFVVGFEVKRSGRKFDCKVCESLAGKYPKDFQFVGWHPNCRCYVVSILKTKEEFWSNSPTSVNEVKDVPEGFKSWIGENSDRIAEAERRGTLPYFVRNNKNYVPMSETIIESAKQGRLDINAINISVQRELITEDIFASNKIYNEKRQQLQKEIVYNYLSSNNVKSDVVYMLGGAPANGKSTLVDSGLLPHPKGVLVVDADKIKSMIPEYETMLKSGNKTLIKKAANFVHEESSMLGKQIQKKAFDKNIGVVIDGVNDGTFNKVAERVADIRQKTGKPVRADYVSLDTDLSIKLAKLRAEKTGRKVPLPYIKNMNREISKLVPQLIENNTFDELYLWDTNINGTPRLILKMVNGKLEISDKKLYEKFLEKAN